MKGIPVVSANQNARAAQIDAAIQAQDRLLLRARVIAPHPKLMARAIATRDALVREWSREIGTRPIRESA